MRVLFTSNSPSPYRTAFFNDLGKLCDLTVLYERRYSRDRTEEWQDAVQCKHYKEIFLKGIKIGNEKSLCPSIIKHLSREKYDIYIVGGYSTPTGMIAITYLKNKKIPFFISTDGGIVKPDSPFKFSVKRLFISSATAWLSTGAATDRYLVHYGANIKRIYRYPFTSLSAAYIEKGATCENEKQNLRTQLGIQEENVVISVGRFMRGKGFDILIKASKNLRDNTGVYIIGGEPTGEYLALREQYGSKHIHFIRFVMPDTLKSFFKASDLFVLPTRGDVWGLVVSEAMANGLPVVTTDKCVAGLELVENYKNGFIVPADDVESLAEKMNVIFDDKNLRQEMAKESLKKIEPYSIENMAKVHYEIFENFLADLSGGFVREDG